MKLLVEFFVRNYKLTIVLTLFFLVFGVMGLLKIQSETFPQVDFAMANITTIYKGASAEDIETKITKPIEDEIRTVTGLKDVRSISQKGRSNVFVRVDMDNVSDVDKVISDIQKAVDRTTGLPKDLEELPKFSELKSEEMPVIELAIMGSNLDRKRDLIADLLKEEIEDNKRVLEVVLGGYAQRRFQIKLDRELLQKHHIGIDEIIKKVQIRNVSMPGGSLKDDTFENLIRLEGKIASAKELENILIRSNYSGSKIYLKDVADVYDSEEEHKVYGRYNGERATLLTIKKKGGSDTLKLVSDVEEKIRGFELRYSDYKFVKYLNEADKVKLKLSILSSNAISGLALVIIFLFIFLPGRIGLMASLSLPVAVMVTMGIMPNTGMTLNSITILALVIALGMLVDNSVVISENFTRLRFKGLSPHDAAIKSVQQLWLPITATAFTTIAAFLPMLVTKGIMGQFIRFIPIIVSTSLLISLFESFFLLPMRLKFVGKTVKKNDTDFKWFLKFQASFEKMMKLFISRRYIVAIGFSVIIITSLLMMVKFNRFVLFPADQTELYFARYEAPIGSKLEHTDKIQMKLIKEIKNVLGDDAAHIAGKAGTANAGPGDPKAKSGSSVGLVAIYVSEYAKYNVPYNVILDKLRKIKMKELKELSFEAKVNGPPVGEPINATFRSNSLDHLNLAINYVKKQLSEVDGIRDLGIDDVVGSDEIFVHVNYLKADQLGLSIRNIGDTISAAISGKKISTVTLDNKDVDIMVRMKGDFKKKLGDLKKVEIMDRRGNLVPLGAVANFEHRAGIPQIKRFDYKRSKTLTGDIEELKMTSHEANILLMNFSKTIFEKYPDVSLVFGGQEESTKESMQSLKEALVLSLIGIFALLVFMFNSFLRPLIIMTTIPLGLVGFSIAFYLHGRPISFLAMIGIIGLGGIIVNSGIVLISFIEEMKKEGELTLFEILVKASGMRLKAVLVTSLTTISGLIPTAYGIGGSDAILVPMTLAMAWGLASGTILTLVWVPCAYAIWEDFSLFFLKLVKKNI